MKRRQRVFTAVAAMLLAWAAPVLGHDGCDDETPKPAVSAENAQQPLGNVAVKLFQFQPARLEVRAGTAVSWVNKDEILHTVTAEKKENGFAASLDGKGGSCSFTFAQPGTYGYFCERHEHMRGEVWVR